MRCSTPRLDQSVLLHPTEQAVQVDSTAVISHGRLLKRNSRVVSEPTGQTSARLPLNGSESETPCGVSISVRTPRLFRSSWLEPEMSCVKRVQRQQRMQRSASKMMCSPRIFRFGRLTLGSRSRLPPPRRLYVTSCNGHSPPLSQIGQSSGWFRSQNSTVPWRALRACAVSVNTSIPSRTGVEQAVWSLGMPFTSTWQMRQTATTFMPG